MLEKPQHLALAEAAEGLGRPVPSLLEMARDGQLALCVFLSGATYDAAWGEHDSAPPWNWDPRRPVFGAAGVLAEVPAGHHWLDQKTINELLLHGSAACVRVDTEADGQRRRFALDPACHVGLGDVVMPASEYERLGGSWDAAAAPVVQSSTVGAPETRPSMRRDGSVWHLEWEGQRCALPDSKGLRVLAVLLPRPHEAFSALHLAVLAEGQAPDAPQAPVFAEPPDEPLLDEEALREVRGQLRRLRQEESEAQAEGDEGRALKAREKREALEDFMAKSTGLGGRSRMIGTPAERARKNISRSVKRAQDLVAGSALELGTHLRKSIKMGRELVYNPPERIDWLVLLD